MSEPIDSITVTWVTGTTALSKAHNRLQDALNRYVLLRADPHVIYGQLSHNDQVIRQFVQRSPHAPKVEVNG